MAEILKNIDGHIFRHVVGFYEKHFESSEVQSVLANVKQTWPADHDAEGRADLLDSLEHGSLTSWFETVAEQHGSECHQEICNKGNRISLITLTRKRCDIRQTDQAFVRAIGVVAQQTEAKMFPSSFIELCSLAGTVFAKDPLRHFVSAFIIWGNTMELWTFDRSGAYCCTPFDIRTDIDRFFHTIKSYLFLKDSQLGAGTYLKPERDSNIILPDNEASASGTSALRLEKKPFFENEFNEIISDCPIIYFSKPCPTTNHQKVAKFKWRKEYFGSEGELLKTASRVHVPAMSQLYHQEDILSTNALRSGLQFGNSLRLTEGDDACLSNFDGDLDDFFIPRSSSEVGDEAYINRILSCTVTYPKGVHLEEYNSPIQVIEAFRDVIQGHRTLYQQCGILHRDVSIFNILLTDRQAQGANADDMPRGLLIDFETALDREHPSTRRQIFGTPAFMAIEVLKGHVPQTYRTDLESFFYSLVWTCISPRSTKIRPPEGSRLWRWRQADRAQLANAKLEDMEEEQFKVFLDEIHPDFKPFRGLIETFRELLFPVQEDGLLCTKTDGSQQEEDTLYDRIINAFQRTIAIRAESLVD